eukprot:13654337-Heterocapsa_arctica.AAC.2
MLYPLRLHCHRGDAGSFPPWARQHVVYYCGLLTCCVQAGNLAGHLKSNDVGLCLHRPLMVNHVTKQVVVQAQPIKAASAHLGGDVDNTPLILSPQLVGLPELMGIRLYQRLPCLHYTFSLGLTISHHLATSSRPSALPFSI